MTKIRILYSILILVNLGFLVMNCMMVKPFGSALSGMAIGFISGMWVALEIDNKNNK